MMFETITVNDLRRSPLNASQLSLTRFSARVTAEYRIHPTAPAETTVGVLTTS